MAVIIGFGLSAAASAAIGTAVTAGTITATTAAVLSTAAAIAASYASTYLAKEYLNEGDPSFDINGRLDNRTSPIEPVSTIYGQGRYGGAYANYITRASVIDFVVVFAYHEVESVTDVWIDSTKVLSTDIDDGDLGNVTFGDYKNIVKIRRYLGTETQTTDPLLIQYSQYTSAHRGLNTAYMAIRLLKNDFWNGGLPRSYNAFIKGKKLYDPRLDSTNGGAGPHRFYERDTHEWSHNPSLCVADYLTDALVGAGKSFDDIDWTSVSQAANTCEVQLATSIAVNPPTIDQYTCNGKVSAAKTIGENLKDLLSSMVGTIRIVNGKFFINAGEYVVPTISINEDDITGAAISWSPFGSLETRYNKVYGVFVDPNKEHAASSFAPRLNPSYVGEDGGQELSKEISLPFTTKEFTAQRISKLVLDQSRNSGTLKLKLKPSRSHEMVIGDNVLVTIGEISFSDKVMQIISLSHNQDGTADVQLREESSAAYNWSVLDSIAVPDVNNPFAKDPPPQLENFKIVSESGLVTLSWDPVESGGGEYADVFISPTNILPSFPTETRSLKGNTFTISHPIDQTLYYWINSRSFNRLVGDPRPGGDGQGIMVVGTSSSGSKNYYQSGTPIGASEGDMWFDTDDNDKQYIYASDSPIAIYQVAFPNAPTGSIGDYWFDTSTNNDVFDYQRYIRTVDAGWMALPGLPSGDTFTDYVVNYLTNNESTTIITYQDSAPSGNNNDLWFDTSDNLKLYKRIASVWTLQVDDGGVPEPISWVPISTAELDAVIASQAAIESAIDGQQTVFVQGPASPVTFDYNDYWLDDSVDPDNQLNWGIYKATNSDNPTWTFSPNDAYGQYLLQTIRNEDIGDQKVRVFYQSGEPVESASNPIDSGDLWVDTDDNQQYRYNGAMWLSIQDSGIAGSIAAVAAIESAIDGEQTLFFQTSAPITFNYNDYWFDIDDGYAIYKAINIDTPGWAAVPNDAYGQQILDQIDIAAIADAKVRVFFQNSAPAGTFDVGDLWYDTNDNNKLYRWSGSSWVVIGNTRQEAGLNYNFQIRRSIFNGATNNQYAYIHGYDPITGAASNTGFDVLVNNTLRSMPAGAIRKSIAAGYWVVCHTSSTTAFNVSGIGFTRYACARKDRAQWSYDNGSGSYTNFTESDNMIIIGSGRSVGGSSEMKNVQPHLDALGLVGADGGGFIGDQRTLPNVTNNNIDSNQYGFTDPLITGTDAGSSVTLSIQAHSLAMAFGNVSYNSGTIANLGFSVPGGILQSHVYVDDADYSGGSVLYEQSVDREDIVGEPERYYVGSINRPENGDPPTGGGGGGGCVHVDSYTIAGQAKDLKLGDIIEDVDLLRDVQYAPITQIQDPVERPCVELVTESGARLTLSKMTPVTLSDGDWLWSYHMLNQEVMVVHDDADPMWEIVTEVNHVGWQWVRPIFINDRSFAAGADNGSRIVTHNGIKGDGPIT